MRTSIQNTLNLGWTALNCIHASGIDCQCWACGHPSTVCPSNFCQARPPWPRPIRLEHSVIHGGSNKENEGAMSMRILGIVPLDKRMKREPNKWTVPCQSGGGGFV